MARRRSLNRRWSRRSANASAVLNQDSNYVDDEDETYWMHLPDQTRYSNRASLNESTPPILNSNSRFIDDSDIESTEWWKNLQKTSQDLLESKAISPTSHLDLENASNHTSASERNSITEEIKKKRVIFGRKRRSSKNNPFSQVLELSNITVESEPVLYDSHKEVSRRLSRSIDELEKRRLKRFEISSKRNSRCSPDTSTSTDTDSRVKTRPVLFKRPKLSSSSAFHKIIQEDDSIVGPSQSLQTSRINSNAEISHENISRRSKTLTTSKNESLVLEKQSKKQENVNVNETKEFNTQPRSPFDKIHSRQSRSFIDEIVSESERDETHEKISDGEEEPIFNNSDTSLNQSKNRKSVTSPNKTKQPSPESKLSLKKIDSPSLHRSVNNSISDSENEKMSEASSDTDENVKSTTSSYKSEKTSNKKDQENDSDLKLYISDEIASEKSSSPQRITDGIDSSLKIHDRTSIQSRRSSYTSSSSIKSISETLKTRNSNHSQRKTDSNNGLSNDNIVDVSENIQNRNSSKINTNDESSNNKMSVMSDKKKLEIINKTRDGSITPQKKSFNNKTRRSIGNQVGERSHQNDQNIEDELASERQEESSDDNILEPFSQPTHNDQLHNENREDSDSDEELNFEKQKRSTNNEIHELSKKLRTHERSFIDERKSSSNEQEINLASKTRKSSDVRKTREKHISDEDDSASKSQQKDLPDKTRKSSNVRKTQEKRISDKDDSASKSQQKDLPDKIRKSSNVRETRERQLTDGDDGGSKSKELTEFANKTQNKTLHIKKVSEKHLSDEDDDNSELEMQNDFSNRAQKSLDLRKIQEKQITDEDDAFDSDEHETSIENIGRLSGLMKVQRRLSINESDESNEESTLKEHQKDSSHESQKSLKQQKAKDTKLNHKTSQTHKESVSSIDESYKVDSRKNLNISMLNSQVRSNLNSSDDIIPEPSAYDLPNRDRSSSIIESNDEPHIDRNNVSEENISGPSISVNPLPSTSKNQRDKSINKLNPPKPNTLDRYFMLSRSRLVSQQMSQNLLGKSNHAPLSQEKMTELENKLKKIKEKTDKAVQKELVAAEERAKQKENLKALESKFSVNVNKKKNDKTPKPINKAYIINGRVYKQPRLPRPQKWVTDRLYKFLWKKMEPKYDLDARVQSEKFVKYLADVVALIKRRKEYRNYKEELNELIKKMAHLGIISTRLEFHHFCYDFLPYEFRVKVNPMLMPGNVRNIPFNPNNLTVPILSNINITKNIVIS